MPQILTMLSRATTNYLNNTNRYAKAMLLGVCVSLCTLTGCQKAVNPPEKHHYVIRGDSSNALWPLAVEDISEEVRITLNSGVPTPEMVVIEEDGRQVTFTGERHGDYLLVPRKFRHLKLLNGQQTVADIILEKD